MKDFLYKKYKPKNIKDFFGHRVIKKIFNIFIKKKIFPSNFIFYGEKGTGKTTFARIFSKSIMCIKKNSCESCKSCTNFSKKIDFIEIDAASNRKVEDINKIFENVMYRPLFSNYKVYILDEVHMLSKHAFNSMLNLLENISNYVKVVMITTDIKKVPKTILSRCFKIFFKRFSYNETLLYLKTILKKENILLFNSNKSIIKYIALNSKGSLRDALVQLNYIYMLIKSKININEIKKHLDIFKNRYAYCLLDCIIKKKNLIKTVKKIIYNNINFKNIYIKILEIANKIIILKEIQIKKMFVFIKIKYKLYKNINLNCIIKLREYLIEEIYSINLVNNAENFLAGILKINYKYNKYTQGQT
ncbi:DNA polymerase III subunit gamma/tau [Candidatus Vidania fulgoroideorum]